MAKVDELVIELRAKTDQFERAMDNAGKKTTGFASVANRAMLAVGAAATAFGALANKAIQVADELSALQARTGVSASTFSALQFAIEDAGGSLSGFAASINIMQDNIGQLANGTESAVKNFARLGLSFDDLKSLTPEQQFFLIADSIGKLGSEFEKTEAARNLFGRGAASLIPIINQANGSVSQFVDTQVELGSALSNEQIERIDALGDSISAMALTIRNRAIGAFADLLHFMGLFETRAEQIEKTTNRIAAIQTGLKRADLPAGIRDSLEKELSDLEKQKQKLDTPAETPKPRDTVIERAATSATKAKSKVQELQEALDDMQKAINRDLAVTGLDESAKAAARAKFEISDLAKRYETELTPAQKKQAEAIIEGRRAQVEAEKSLESAKEKAKEAADASRDMAFAFESAFENAIVAGEDLGDVLNALAQDIAKLVIKKNITAPLIESIFGGDTGGGFFSDLFAGFRAEGGAVQSGMPYVVGEKRPEIFVPQTSGRIVPSTSGMGSSGVRINIINNTSSRVSAQSSQGADGGMDLRFMIDEAVAQNVATQGSRTNQALKSVMGASLTNR